MTQRQLLRESPHPSGDGSSVPRLEVSASWHRPDSFRHKQVESAAPSRRRLGRCHAPAGPPAVSARAGRVSWSPPPPRPDPTGRSYGSGAPPPRRVGQPRVLVLAAPDPPAGPPRSAHSRKARRTGHVKGSASAAGNMCFARHFRTASLRAVRLFLLTFGVRLRQKLRALCS